MTGELNPTTHHQPIWWSTPCWPNSPIFVKCQGTGEPLFSKFAWEDWQMLELRVAWMALALGTIFSHWKWKMIILETQLIFQAPGFPLHHDYGRKGILNTSEHVIFWNKDKLSECFLERWLVFVEGWGTGLFIMFFVILGKETLHTIKECQGPLELKNRVPFQPFWGISGRFLVQTDSKNKQKHVQTWDIWIFCSHCAGTPTITTSGDSWDDGRCEVQLHLLVHGYKHAMNDPQRAQASALTTWSCWRGKAVVILIGEIWRNLTLS